MRNTEERNRNDNKKQTALIGNCNLTPEIIMPLLTAGLTFYFKKKIRHFEMKPLEYIEGDGSTARFK